MKKLGIVLHVTPSRALILRSSSPAEIGRKALDRRGAEVGEICDVFGPVSNPYIAVRPKVSKPEDYVGKTLYVEEP